MNQNAFVRLFLSLMLLTVPAAAATIFDNFGTGINGGIDAWTISLDDSISDSFTLGSGATIDGVNFGLWLPGGDAGTGGTASIDWAIGTAHSDSSLGFGTVKSVSVAYIGPDGYGLGDGIFDASFSFSGPALAAGTTYYLTLQNYSDARGNIGSWDENDGPNSLHAWSSALAGPITFAAGTGCGGQGVGTGTCSESFQILGTPTGQGVPEPTTWALFGSGILAAFVLRRKAIHR